MSDLRKLLDRAEIYDLHAAYCHALDSGNVELTRACFADNVLAKYDGREPVRGIDRFMDSVQIFGCQKAGEWKITTHFLGNMLVKSLEGDRAETEINVLAFLILPGTPEKVAMRSLRYLDRLERIGGKWLIVERIHTLDWSTETDAVYALSVRQRLSALHIQEG